MRSRGALVSPGTQYLSRQRIGVREYRRMVEGWRANAHEALTADDYRASVDKFLQDTVDARVNLPRQGQIVEDEEGDEDDHPRL